jgi:hypothetical protein
LGDLGVLLFRLSSFDTNKHHKSAEEVVMKTDALTLAAIIFVVGLLATGLSVSEKGESSAEDAPAAELHQGVIVKR